MDPKACHICKVKNDLPTATLMVRGAETICKAAIEREDDLKVKEGDIVHVDCRKNYTNKTTIFHYNKNRRESNSALVPSSVHELSTSAKVILA